MTRHAIAGALLTISLGAGAAGAQQADTAVRQALFSHSDALLAAGFVVGIAATMPFDQKIAAWSQSASVQHSANSGGATVFNDYGAAVIVMSLGTYGIGRISGSRPFAELGLRATEAVVFSSAISAVTKALVGRQRPYVDINNSHYYAFPKGFKAVAYQSMPSGHTTAAFAFAAAVTDETAHLWPRQTWWVGTITYGSATMVGVARLISNKHWASDVVGGAFVGTLTGLGVTRFHRAHPNSRLDRWLLPVAVTPTKSGVAMVWTATF